MFREMLRIRQALSREECIEVLQTVPRGVLSVKGEDGYPYGMPMNFWYDPEKDRIYFHGGMKGHKIDALKADDRVSFCCYDEGFRRPDEWALNIRSVIIFGRVRFLEDQDLAMEVSRKLSYRFTKDEAYIDEEVRRSGPRTLCFELIPEHMTGKLVNES